MVALAGILLLVVMGFVLGSVIGQGRLSLGEVIGLSFPLGAAMTSFLVLLLDMVGPFSWNPWLILTQFFVLMVALLSLRKGCRYRSSFPRLFRSGSDLFVKGSYNALFWVVLLVVVYIEWLNFYTTMSYPTFDRDGVVAFDVVGYVLSHEQTLKGLSIFQAEENPFIHGPGSCIAYAPLFQIVYGYVYWAGWPTSKVVPALMFLSFLISLYFFGRRFMTPTSSILMTFAVLITPRMLEYSCYSLLNVMQTVYTTMGVLYIYLWRYRNRDEDGKPFLIMSAILFSAAVLSRLEAIVFPFAAGILLLFYVLRRRIKIKDLILWSLIILVPLAIWLCFQKISGLASVNFYITHLFWNADKAGQIAGGFIKNFGRSADYGWVFYYLFIAVIANLIFFKGERKKRLFLFYVILISMFVYGVMLYHVDYLWDTLDRVLYSSSMRFFLSFIPLAWFYIFESPLSQKFFLWLDSKLSISGVLSKNSGR